MGLKEDGNIHLENFLKLKIWGLALARKSKPVHLHPSLYFVPYLQVHARLVAAWALAQLLHTTNMAICHRFIISESPSD